jgi:hypothetical protein
MNRFHINKFVQLSGAAMALALFVGLAAKVQAQENGAKGGAIKLLEFSGGGVKATATVSNYQPMPCAKCKDEATQRVDWTARGANKPTILVSMHLCEGCATTLSTAGFGKEKHQVATHKCTSCGAENLACCNTKKGSLAATKGMEKKLEVAPLK